MSSELQGAGDPAPRRAASAKPRVVRSRVAKPLLTSLGTLTMLAAGSFVIMAVAATGSMLPWDWTRADPSAAASRFQQCGDQGLGAVGCMLSTGFRPAAAVGSAGHGARHPLMSVATVQDQPVSGTSQASRTGTARGSAPSPRPGESHRRVTVPAGASTENVEAACTTAMKTAQTQGAAAMTEVEDECEEDLATRCPAVKMPQTQGMAAIDEMEAECRSTTRPSPWPSPWRDE